MTNIVDFAQFKGSRDKFSEKVESSDFQLNRIRSHDSEVVFYVSDTEEQCVLVFGCSGNDVLSVSKQDTLSWSHLVQAWEIIANPSLGFDETFKLDTMRYIIRSLPGLKSWKETYNTLTENCGNIISHIFIEIDRQDIVEPKDLKIISSAETIIEDK